MQEKLIFVEIHELVTLSRAAKKGGRHVVEDDLGVIRDGALVCENGRILWRGERQELDRFFSGRQDRDAFQTVPLGGRDVLPGFVECHTHLLFAGDRTQEFEWRIQGQTYQEISAKGGGIASTVRATRAASVEELKHLGQTRVNEFVRQGVTAIEVKSGYGLNFETEARILRVAGQLRGPHIVRTYLGPHSKSPEFPDLARYMDHIVEHDLPTIKAERLADRVDIYIEKGFFDLDMGRRYFAKAKELGLPISAHVEQLSAFGGANLALDFSPQSVDHVVYLEPEGIQRLASSDAVAVLLPASDLYLRMKYPPARDLIEAGAAVALSTDFNPGTSPTQDLSLVGVLARLEMRMLLPEVICALTFGAAKALGKDAEWGSLDQGKCCDFMTLDGSWRELFYSIGRHPVQNVYKAGQILEKSF
ncbi:MAG: imidazolonepropionase [Bdellovibrionales bacterium]